MQCAVKCWQNSQSVPLFPIWYWLCHPKSGQTVLPGTCLPSSSLTAYISTPLLTLNDPSKLPSMVSFGSFHPSWWIVTLIWWDLLSIWSQLVSLTLLVCFLQAFLVFLTLAWVYMVVLMYWMMSGVVEKGILVCNWYGQFPMFLADYSYFVLLFRQGIDC